MGITVATDIMAATATTHGVDAVAMDMAATDTTAAKSKNKMVTKTIDGPHKSNKIKIMAGPNRFVC